MATQSYLSTINLNPSIAYQFNSKLSLGVGIDVERIDAVLASHSNSLTPPTPLPNDIISTNKGNSWGYGWNIGMLYQFTPQVRVGLAYRSQVIEHVSGTTTFQDIPSIVPPSVLPPVTANKTTLTLPDSVILSAHYGVNARWALMGDLQFTRWDRVQQLVITYPNMGSRSLVPLHYHNTWRIAVGTNYQLTHKLKLRCGAAFDETPTNSKYRTAMLPDANAYWLAAGINYALTNFATIDLSVVHLFFDSSHMYQTTPNSRATLNAKYSAYGDLIGAQLNINLSKLKKRR